jgi:hypothetical protein
MEDNKSITENFKKSIWHKPHELPLAWTLPILLIGKYGDAMVLNPRGILLEHIIYNMQLDFYKFHGDILYWCYLKDIIHDPEFEVDTIQKAILIYLDWLDGKKDVAPKGDYSIKDMMAYIRNMNDVDEDDFDFAKRLNELRKVQKEKILDELIEMRWSVLKDVEEITKEIFISQAKFFFEAGYEKRKLESVNDENDK